MTSITPHPMVLEDLRAGKVRLLAYREPASTSGQIPGAPPEKETGALAVFPVYLTERTVDVDQPSALLQLEIERLVSTLANQRSESITKIEQAHESGWKEGHTAAHQECAASIRSELDRARTLLGSLEDQAKSYLTSVEREVVALSLDIAHRVLQHEAQIDRLLLSGAVRLALEGIRDGGKAQMRVPATDLVAWQTFLHGVFFSGQEIEIKGETAMAAGECLCELSSGTLDLGVRAQLGEVERSFADILHRRQAPRKEEHTGV